MKIGGKKMGVLSEIREVGIERGLEMTRGIMIRIIRGEGRIRTSNPAETTNRREEIRLKHPSRRLKQKL